MVVSSIPGRRTIGWLVLGWLTAFGRHTTSVYVTDHIGQLSLLPSVGREMRTAKVGDALRPEVKAGWLIPFVDKRVGGR